MGLDLTEMVTFVLIVPISQQCCPRLLTRIRFPTELRAGVTENLNNVQNCACTVQVSCGGQVRQQ